jgi:eukaryotic-like serine/threonine-protein kinase
VVRGELDWIVMKCLEKDRGRRYDTANGLARDVQRYLADEPVEACPPSAAYRLRKAARKYRAPLVMAAVVAGLLAAGVVVLAVALAAVDQERRAKEAALEAEGKRRKQARAALDTMSSQVIEDWLAIQPVLRPEHRRLLEQALTHYEEFAADTGQLEESRFGVAEAFERVGEIRERLGLRADAEVALKRSRDLYAALATDFPDTINYRHGLARTRLLLGRLYRYAGRNAEAEAVLRQAVDDYGRLAAAAPAQRYGLARCLDVLGEVLKNSDRPGDAEAVFGQALTIWKDLAAEAPAAARYRHSLAVGRLNLGNLLNDRTRAADALALHDQAVALLDPLVAEQPSESVYRDTLVRTLNSRGVELRALKRFPEAEAALSRAMALNHRLVTDFPAVPAYRRSQGVLLATLGVVHKDQKRAKEAEESYDQAVTVLKQLAADFPAAPDYQNEAASAMSNLAGMMMARKAFPDARRVLADAAPYHQAALKASSDNPAYRRAYRVNRIRTAEVFIAQKDHAAAATAIQEVQQLAVDPPQDAYLAACLLAGCARVAAQDERLTEAQRRESAAGYGDRATGALRRAVELNAKEVARIHSDGNLAPLHGRPDFQMLLTELSGRGVPGMRKGGDE